MRFRLFMSGLPAAFILVLTNTTPAHAAFPSGMQDEIHEKYAGSIYEIEAVAPGRQSGPVATGFKVSASGHIITAFHLVKDFTIPLEDLNYFARLPGSDQRYRLTFDWHSEDADLLLLRSSHPHLAEARPLPLARAGEFRAREVLVFGLGEDRQLERTVVQFIRPDATRASFWVIKGTFNPGLSGSPVFDARGRVIGLMHANTGRDRSSFAPIHLAESVLGSRGIAVAAETGALLDWQQYLLLGVALLIPVLMILGFVASRRNRA